MGFHGVLLLSPIQSEKRAQQLGKRRETIRQLCQVIP